MRTRAGKTLEAWRKLFLTTAGVVALAVSLVVGALTAAVWAQAPTAHAPVPQWQAAAGGKKAFDVASVKLNKSGLPPSGDPPHANFPLEGGDGYSANGGLLSVTNFPLNIYIGFAYKLTPYQTQSLLTQLPKWATMERFDIQARVDGNPTKDQMRLMMQSLLADRFKLAIHTETRQLPVFGLVLVKPGKTGSRLQPHSDDLPCSSASAPTPSVKVAGGFAPLCGVLSGQVVSGRMQMSSRNISMGYLANYLGVVGRLDRPVFDQTGLSGNFDLTMDAPDLPPPPGAVVQPDPLAPTFLEVLQDQLGLKLERQTGPVDVLIIDHMEELSPN